MKKKLILLFILKTIFLFAQIKDTEKKELKGNVKEVKYYKNGVLEKSYEFNEKGFFSKLNYFSNNKPQTACEWIYNDEGQLISIKDEFNIQNYKYNSDGKVIQITDLKTLKRDTIQVYYYKYENQNLIETVAYKYSEKNKRMWDKILYEYDTSNNLIKEVNYGASAVFIDKPKYPQKEMENRIPIIYLYTYDLSNNLIEKVGRPENRNEISSRYSYKYDSKNNKTEYRKEWPNNSASSYETYVYDDKNNLIEISSYNLDNELIYKDIYTYDDNNNQTSRTHFFKNEKTSSTECIYDSKKNKIEERNYNKGKLRDIKTRVFDYFGNEIQLKIFDKNGKILFHFKSEIMYY